MVVALEWARVDEMATVGTLTQAVCRDVINSILERTGANYRVEMPTTREWFLTKFLPRLTPGTREAYQAGVNGFLAHLGKRADRPLMTITSADVDEFIAGLVTAGELSPRTVRDKYLGPVKAAFTRAVRLGILASNPASAVEIRVDGDGDEEQEVFEREVFTPAEVGLLIKSAPSEEWRTLILLGYYTGLRMMKCATLKWDQVDLTAGTITAIPGKRGKKANIPIVHSELRRALDRAAGVDHPEEYVLPGLSGRECGGKRGISRDFLEIARQAGVDLRPMVMPNGRTQFRRSFHALRHTFISALANADISADVRRKLTGHKTAAVHDIYTHLDHKVLSEAIGKIEDVG